MKSFADLTHELMLNALFLPCEEALTLIPPSCSDHFIHFSGLFKKKRKKEKEEKKKKQNQVHSEDGFYLDK